MRVALTTAGVIAALGLAAHSAVADSPRAGGIELIAQNSEPRISESLYRDGQPEVLKPPPEEKTEIDTGPAVREFSSLYAARNRPRMAIFYNREFSDRLTQWFGVSRVVMSGNSDARVSGEVEKTLGKVDLKGSNSGTRSVGAQQLLTDPKRKGLNGVDGWRFESEFSKPFHQAGARLIDRATVMRLTAATQAGAPGTPDVQHIETKALTGYADILVEILFEEFISEETGAKQAAFRVTAKSVDSGEVIAQILAEPETAKGKRDYVGTRSGFLPVEEKPKRPDGTEVAVELMEALNAAWAR